MLVKLSVKRLVMLVSGLREGLCMGTDQRLSTQALGEEAPGAHRYSELILTDRRRGAEESCSAQRARQLTALAQASIDLACRRLEPIEGESPEQARGRAREAQEAWDSALKCINALKDDVKHIQDDDEKARIESIVERMEEAMTAIKPPAPYNLRPRAPGAGGNRTR